MHALSSFLAGLCFAGVLGGIVHLLSPGGTTDKAVRLAAALFVLAGALLPLRSLSRSVTPVQTQIQTDAAVQAVLDNARSALSQCAKEVLSACGYPDAEVRIVMQVRDGTAHAAQFCITGIPPEKAGEIADEIYALTGEMPTVEASAAQTRGG